MPIELIIMFLGGDNRSYRVALKLCEVIFITMWGSVWGQWERLGMGAFGVERLGWSVWGERLGTVSVWERLGTEHILGGVVVLESIFLMMMRQKYFVRQHKGNE